MLFVHRILEDVLINKEPFYNRSDVVFHPKRTSFLTIFPSFRRQCLSHVFSADRVRAPLSFLSGTHSVARTLKHAYVYKSPYILLHAPSLSLSLFLFSSPQPSFLLPLRSMHFIQFLSHFNLFSADYSMN